MTRARAGARRRDPETAPVAWRRCAFVALALSFSVTLEGLDPSRAITDYGRTTWQDDLPQNTVNDIVQTRDGYIWLGTYEGLARFDGARFTAYNMRNTPAIRSNGVLTLFEARDGSLWFGTDGGGLSVQRDGRFETFTTSEGLAGDRVYDIAEDQIGNLWIATTEGISRFGAGRFANFDETNGLPTSDARALEVDAEGNVWAGLDGGALCRIGSSGITIYDGHDGLPGEAIRSLHLTPDGTLWIGTEGGGIAQFRGNRVVDRLSKKDGLMSDFVRPIMTDRDGNVWIATNGGGLQRYHEGVIAHLTTKEGLPNDLVRSLCEDREGNIWVGTNGGGLTVIRDDKFVTWGANQGFPGEAIRAVTEGRSGEIWVGTEGQGLLRIQNGVVTTFAEASGLRNLFVRSVLEDHRGDLWVGTVGGGLYRMRQGKVVEAFTLESGLSSLLISALYEDRKGRVWIGTADRTLHVIDDGVMRAVTLEASEPATPVSAILEDREGRIWIGSDVGLYRLDGDRSTRFTTADGLASTLVLCVLETREGDIWIGTPRGMSRFRNGRFTSYSVEDGLFHDTVLTIFEDDDGFLWTSSSRGISRIRTSDFDALDRKEIPALRPLVFDKNDGLRSNQANGHSQPAGWKGRDGRLWFATVRGLSTIDPRRIKFNLLAPPVVIEKLVVDERELRTDRPLTLPSGGEHFEIQYTALSFIAPGRVRFRYKLEGNDEGWTDAGTRRTAYFNNIPSGRYRFLVQACNNDGVWNETGAAFEFFVETPLWKRWWALALYALVAFAAVWAAIRWRLGALKARARVLEARVAERTTEIAEKVRELEVSEARAQEASEAKGRFLAHMSHELRTPLNAILGFVQLMERTPARTKDDRDSLSVITRSGQHLLALINDVLSIAKIEAGQQSRHDAPFDLHRLVADLESLFSVRAEESGLNLEVRTAKGVPRYVTGDEGKIRQVLVNLLGNAFKFTQQGEVRLSLATEGERVSFAVDDSGPGLTPEEIAILAGPFAQTSRGKRAREGTGLGLAISRSFIALMGGELRIESTPGRGSRFSFTLPMPTVEAVEERVERGRVLSLERSDRPPCILVAEDRAESRTFLVRLLRSVGFTVAEAANGREAVDAWRSVEPELILMDVQMPVMEGDVAAMEIRREEAASGRKRTVIVALTAGAFEHQKETLLARGCDDFVAKPFLEATIFEAIARNIGVTYRYEETVEARRAQSADLDLSVLATIDHGWLESLQTALGSGDVESANRLADEIETEHPPIAVAIRKMIRAYRLDDLERAVVAARRKAAAG